MSSSKRRRVELLWAKARHRSTPLEEALTAANAVYRIADADDDLRDEFAARAAFLALALTTRQTVGMVRETAGHALRGAARLTRRLSADLDAIRARRLGR